MQQDDLERYEVEDQQDVMMDDVREQENDEGHIEGIYVIKVHGTQLLPFATCCLVCSAQFNVFCMLKLDVNVNVFVLIVIKGSTCCLTTLYVMGFTSGLKRAGSDDDPFIEIRLFNGEKKTVRFPDNSGNDMVRKKGDLWTIPFSKFGFKSCVKKGNVESVVVKPGGNDGWNIQSIVTMVSTSGSEKQLLTSDMGVNRWIDGNGPSAEKQFQLTKLDC